MPHKIYLTSPISVGATRVVSLDLQDDLRSGVTLTGTPSVEEVGGSDLVIDNKSVSSDSLTIDGRSVAAGKAIQFRVSGQKAGKRYLIDVSCGTTGSPAETQPYQVVLEVI